jgi:hypothetical protein
MRVDIQAILTHRYLWRLSRRTGEIAVAWVSDFNLDTPMGSGQIRFVSDVDKAVRFYEVLGLTLEIRSRSGHWVELQPLEVSLACS